MSIGVCYLVREIVENNISHEFRTKSFIKAVADSLIKIRSPITNHVNSNSWKTDVRVEVKSYPTKYSIDGILDYEYRIIEKKTGKLLIKLQLKSQLYRGILDTSISGINAAHYDDKIQAKAKLMIEDRIKEWTNNDLGVITVLACCAALNPDHLFWQEQGMSGRGISLSM